jgi:hypothetical protein
MDDDDDVGEAIFMNTMLEKGNYSVRIEKLY